ncbi:MAG: outer membrane lipoprotein chaperone LolA [Aquabacterium sp.]
MRSGLLALWLVGAALPAQADAVDTLREFTRDSRTGSAAFTQVVTSTEGGRRKSSAGRFEFSRPDRFRFDYRKPFEQTIVGDGARLWLHDLDLNQVTVRPLKGALGASPAALLAGASLEREFDLQAQPARDGLNWVQATPKVAEGTVRLLRVGFRGRVLAALEIEDAFGQRSRLDFTDVQVNPRLADDTFRFTPPKGADVIEQK